MGFATVCRVRVRAAEAFSEPHALPQIARNRLARFVPRVLLNATARNIGERCRRGMAGAHRMTRHLRGDRLGLAFGLGEVEGAPTGLDAARYAVVRGAAGTDALALVDRPDNRPTRLQLRDLVDALSSLS